MDLECHFVTHSENKFEICDGSLPKLKKLKLKPLKDTLKKKFNDLGVSTENNVKKSSRYFTKKVYQWSLTYEKVFDNTKSHIEKYHYKFKRMTEVEKN